MSKKSFKDINPALQFISAPAPAEKNTDNAVNTPNTDSMFSVYNTHRSSSSTERKSKRLNLLLQPSLLEDIAKIAHMKRTSVNDLINTVLKEYRAVEAKSIEEYERVFGEGN